MAGENMKVEFGLMSVDCKREAAKITAPTIAYLCIGGQPRSNVIGDGSPGPSRLHEASPRRQPNVCEVCGPITDVGLLVRGVKSGKTYTLVDAEALNAAKEEFGTQYGGSISLVPHPAEEFLLQTGEGKALHYLTPADAASADHYALLAQLIANHPEVAFAGLYTPRSATALFHITVREGVLVMVERTRTDALKPLPSVGGTVNAKFLSVLEGTLSTFTEPYAPEAYEDRYAAAVTALVDAGEVLAVDETTKTPVKAMTDDELMAKIALLAEAGKKTTKKKAKASA